MPLVLYGSTISYFTGKLEAALRYKEIDYRLEPMRSQAQRPVGVLGNVCTTEKQEQKKRKMFQNLILIVHKL
jgi:hypothetical protein